MIFCACSSEIEPPQSDIDRSNTTAPPWFADVATERGIRFAFDSGHRDRHYLPEIMAGGAALFDMDNDGDLDAYMVQAGNLDDPTDQRPGNQLFRNNGEGFFVNATPGSGSDDRGYGMGVCVGDYDADGDADLYVTNVGPNVLLQNLGEGRFSDLSRAAAVDDPEWGTGAVFLDFDIDGDLDLFVVNYLHWTVESDKECVTVLGEPDYCGPTNYNTPLPDALFRNNGNGTFADVRTEAGLAAAYGNGLGVISGDFDDDGWTDIFVANDATKNQLWMNQLNGTFIDEAVLRGCAVDDSAGPKSCMGVNAVDIDDNGTLDLHVVNMETQTDSFYRNQGEYFSDVTATTGLALGTPIFTRFGTGILDLDNDGWLDLYSVAGRIFMNNPKLYSSDPFAEPNILFRGQPGARFEQVLPQGGTEELLVGTSRAAAFGDVDNDGGMDVLVVNRDAPALFLRNIVEDRGNWLILQVVESTGSAAEGARVVFQMGSQRKRRDVRTAYSYLSANDPRIHIGLGAEARVSEVEVRWTDGEVELYGEYEANQIVHLARGKGLSAAVE